MHMCVLCVVCFTDVKRLDILKVLLSVYEYNNSHISVCDAKMNVNLPITIETTVK